MPICLDVDWSLAKSLFVSGLTTREIAKRIGINVAAVHSRSRREGWMHARSVCAVAVTAKHVAKIEESLMDRGKRALRGILGDAEATVELATTKLKEPKNWGELATKENAMGALTKRVMLASGLDQPGSNVILSFTRVSDQGSSEPVISTVIDIESTQKPSDKP